MQGLIKAKRKAQTALQPINDRVSDRFGHTKERNRRDQRHSEAMGRRMGNQPPAPMERGIGPRQLLLRHPIALENEIAHEVSAHQKDQQIESVDDTSSRTGMTLREDARSSAVNSANLGDE